VGCAPAQFAAMAHTFDEHPFIIPHEQEKNLCLQGLDAQKGNIAAAKAVTRILCTSLLSVYLNPFIRCDGEVVSFDYRKKVDSSPNHHFLLFFIF
jgi:hypothetical protein